MKSKSSPPRSVRKPPITPPGRAKKAAGVKSAKAFAPGRVAGATAYTRPAPPVPTPGMRTPVGATLPVSGTMAPGARLAKPVAKPVANAPARKLPVTGMANMAPTGPALPKPR